ncbi:MULTISPECIES: hypothetical protein [unclassified Saccharothrix]|uniref:hypothetical protein n=1 Tax=unclassified Saccharothrix TaxID=2593673 RepID=UPI00307D6FCF
MALPHRPGGGERALFIGDLVHTPLQFVEPDCEACLSEDEDAAARQRRRILEHAADTNALVLPAHLPGPGAAEVTRDGEKFAVKRWAPFSPVV